MLTDAFIDTDKDGLIKNNPKVLFHMINGAITHSSKWFRTDDQLDIEQLADELYTMCVK